MIFNYLNLIRFLSLQKNDKSHLKNTAAAGTLKWDKKVFLSIYKLSISFKTMLLWKTILFLENCFWVLQHLCWRVFFIPLAPSKPALPVCWVATKPARCMWNPVSTTSFTRLFLVASAARWACMASLRGACSRLFQYSHKTQRKAMATTKKPSPCSTLLLVSFPGMMRTTPNSPKPMVKPTVAGALSMATTRHVSLALTWQLLKRLKLLKSRTPVVITPRHSPPKTQSMW